ncbi:MAG: hypothetical protein ABIJ45_08500 [Candidatus Zixiibacteriota bacterium]
MKFNMVSKSIIYVALMFLFIMSFDAIARTMVIPEEQEILVRFDSNMKITSKTVQAGVPLLVYLAEDIQIGGVTVVEAGAQGRAEVVEVKPAKSGGKPGYIKVEFKELSPKGNFNTSDGSKIQLKGVVENTGKPKKFIPYFIFVIFVNGGQGIISTDVLYKTQIKETVVMESP